MSVSIRAYLKGRMSFLSSNVQLAGFYTDGTQNILTTDVYANGVMQVEVWVSINYNGSTAGIKPDINNYVYSSTTIYQLSGSSKTKVNWTKSATSNPFLHDIKRGGLQSEVITSDYRVPIYLTVPKEAGGLYKWIAKLGKEQTSSSSPVQVNVTTIAVSLSDVDFSDVTTLDQSVLRSIRYTHATLPGNHLLKQWQLDGVHLMAGGGNCWIVMAHDGYSCGALFTGKDKIVVGYCNRTYRIDRGECEVKNPQSSDGLTAGETEFTTSQFDWEDPNDIASSFVQQASSNGRLAMVGVIPCSSQYYNFHLWSNSSSGHANFTYNPVAQDNFGNLIKLIMNWNDTSKGGNHNRDWIITDVQLGY